MSWAFLTDIILKLFRGSSDTPRVDYESVTKMWQELGEQLSARIDSLEANLATMDRLLDACRKSHHGKFQQIEKLEEQLSKSEAERRKLEQQIKRQENDRRDDTQAM